MDTLSIVVICVLFLLFVWGSVGMAIADRYAKVHGRYPEWKDLPWWVWILTGVCVNSLLGRRIESRMDSLRKARGGGNSKSSGSGEDVESSGGDGGENGG